MGAESSAGQHSSVMGSSSRWSLTLCIPPAGARMLVQSSVPQKNPPAHGMGSYTCTILCVIYVVAFSTSSWWLLPLLWAPNCIWCGESRGAAAPSARADG